MCVSRSSTLTNIRARHRLDLRDVDREDFVHCRKITHLLPPNTVIPIKISQLDIRVQYTRLMGESLSSMSLIESLAKTLFFCKLREFPAFRDCCDANCVDRSCTAQRPRMWIDVCEIVGRILMVVISAIPYYARVLIYYVFEHQEAQDQMEAVKRGQFPSAYLDYHWVFYFTPVHPVFVIAFFIYLSVGIYLVCYRKFSPVQSRFHYNLCAAFLDLKRMSWLKAMTMFIRNLLFPFKRYGIFGCVACLIIYPVTVHLSFIVCFIFSLPVCFLTGRIVRHSMNDADPLNKSCSLDKLRLRLPSFDNLVDAFESEALMDVVMNHRMWLKQKRSCCHTGMKLMRRCRNLLQCMIALLYIYSVLILMAETVGFVAVVGCYTLMGLVVNASSVLKYGSMILLVIIYTHDTCTNVTKKYQKLNNALFSDIKNRVSGLAEFTALPSFLQDNMGFKGKDSNATDDFAISPLRHWNISDLILFVDSEDTPRIPKQIFNDACDIKTSGAPGPMFRSLINASRQFFVIVVFLVFVFIVIMSFGDAYKISSTNQMLAALAGGFIPLMFNTLLKPRPADIDTNLVGFKSKLEEIIKNCRRSWPMRDLVFSVENPSHPPSDTPHRDGYITCDLQSSEVGEKYSFDLTNPLIEPNEIKGVLERMSFRPAAEQAVDFVVLLDEVDDVPDWEFRSSSDDLSLGNLGCVKNV